MSETVKTKTQKKDAATQTHSIDTMLEIARLQEQVKLLTIENEHLRKYTVEEPLNCFKPMTPVKSPNNVDETPKRTRSAQKSLPIPSTQKKNNKMPLRGCTCKGKCSSKMCGCVKKDVQCGESCKCNIAVCRNQASKDMDQDKENLENVELMQKQVKNKEIVNKHSANATVCKSMFSPDVAKDDLDFDVEQLRTSSLHFGSPKQLTFGSDKEEKEKEEEIKEKQNNKKLTKRDKNEHKNLTKRRGRSKKINSALNNTEHMQKIKDTSSEEEKKQNDQKTNSSFSETETETTEKMKEIEKRTNNYSKNIANGMVSLRRGQKGSKQASAKRAKANVISDSDSKEETSPVHVKEKQQNKISNNSNTFRQTEINFEETITSDENQSNTTNESENNEFNPMKPKHELSRTPIRGLTASRKVSDISVSLSTTAIEEDTPIPEEFGQAEVDWEEYQSRLVACGKCKRKFHPLRVKKHESCCKKL